MPDTFITYRSGTTGQTVRAILYQGNRAWNPAANGGAGAFDVLTSGNWSQHLLPMTDPQSLGVYMLDLSGLSPALPAGPFDASVYVGAAAGAAPVAGTGALYWTGTEIGRRGFTGNGNLKTALIDDATGQVVQPTTLPPADSVEVSSETIEVSGS